MKLLLGVVLVFVCGAATFEAHPFAKRRQQAPARTKVPTQPQRSAEPGARLTVAAIPAVPAEAVAENHVQRLALADKTFVFAKRTLHVRRAASTDEFATTDQYWELRDPSGAVIFRRPAITPGIRDRSFEETESVAAHVLKTKFGHALIVEGDSEPSAPDSGGWVQVFGIVDGKLAPFGPPVTSGDFIGEAVDSYTVSPMFRGQAPRTVERDVLNFRLWTGNFNIIYPVQINWMTGSIRPAWRCLSGGANGPGLVDVGCRYKLYQTEAVRNTTDLTFVRLFSEPDEHMGVPAHVVVRPNSRIEFLEASVLVDWVQDANSINFEIGGGSDAAGVWLHLKIDGHEGWIHSEEDFEAVGLPQAG